ncbi:response regulator receiver domain-containing protein [Candidatus Magnetoovum chiemensis]|nr:response regulator receiver domain-containing protein [Candidatus Magnetoovum chiemensis]
MDIGMTKRSALRIRLILILGAVLTLPCFVGAEVALNQDMDGVVFSSYINVLEDASRSLTIDDVKSRQYESRFVPIKTGRTSFGITSSAWWVSLTAINGSDETINWLLETDYPYIDYIELYVFNGDDRQPIVMRSGDHLPFNTRAVPSETVVFPIDTAPRQQSRIYMRMVYEESGVVNTYLRAWGHRYFDKYKEKMGFVHGALIGTVIFFLFYNFAVFLSIRFREYFWYVLYLGCCVILYLSTTGIGYRYLWNSSSLITDGAPILSFSLVLILITQFTRVFLDTGKFLPIIDRLLVALNVICAAAAALYFLDMKVVIYYLLIPCGLITSLYCFLGLIVWVKGKIEARSYTVATVPWFFSIIISLLRYTGYAPMRASTIWVSRVCFIIESLLLSLALVDRINILRRDKDTAQRLYSEALEHSKEELEIKVRHRTAELEQAKNIAEMLACTDPLTELNNRRAFYERGGDEVTRIKRYKHPLSVIMFDIDKFKSINDTYGHAVGDEVIRNLALLITVNTRKCDIAGRLGGEEFALILTETQLEAALFVAEDLRAKVEAFPVTVDGVKIRFTSSFGAAEFKASDRTLDGLLARADKALYRAKGLGRNRVEADR